MAMTVKLSEEDSEVKWRRSRLYNCPCSEV